MARSALCVGINEFKNLPASGWLNGCVNDANDMAAALRKRGFASRSTTVLRDGEATKEAVMRALTSMVAKAKPGDHVVFSFSTHGTQIPNQPGYDAETDGLDDAFACHDIKPAGDQWDWATVIIDDELGELFTHVLEGVLLEVFLDTSHSGSGLRDLGDIQREMMMGRRLRYLPPPTRRGLDLARTLAAASPRRTVDRQALFELTKRRRGARPVIFAACKPMQTASEATFDGRSNGAFTYMLLKALDGQPGATRADLLKAITAGFKARDFEQRSILEGPFAAKKVGIGQSW